MRKLIRVLLRSFPILRFLPSFNFDFINSSVVEIREESRKIKFFFEWIVLFIGILQTNERWWWLFLFVWEFMHDQWIYSIKFIKFRKLSIEIKIQEAASSLILLSCLQIIKFTHALREFFFNLSPHCWLPTYHNFTRS